MLGSACAQDEICWTTL